MFETEIKKPASKILQALKVTNTVQHRYPIL
jgi:hypothetical protein